MAREWPHLHGAGNDSVFAGVHRPHRLDHYAQGYYKNPDGTSTSEVDMIRQALRPLRLLYGPTPAVECALKALRLAMMKPREERDPVQIECLNYAHEHGADKPEMDNWRWPG